MNLIRDLIYLSLATLLLAGLVSGCGPSAPASNSNNSPDVTADVEPEVSIGEEVTLDIPLVLECPADSEMVNKECVSEQTVPCADIAPPENGQQIEADVTITFTDADGWSDPAECEWECVADYELQQDACINEQVVPCTEITPPDDAHQMDEQVTITYTDANGWSEPEECAWECDADYDLFEDTCINEQVVFCAETNPPDNAHEVTAEVTITYSDADGWSLPAECAWECDADFDLQEELCISELTVACADIEVPENAHQIDGTVTITFTDADGWSEAADCGWECNEDFDLLDDLCVTSLTVDCADIVPPDNGHQIEGEVTISFTSADGWSEPAPCTWECDADYSIDAELCINEQTVDCSDIIPPDNGVQVEGEVTITYSDSDGWTEPTECAWECVADFDLVEGNCIDEQLVDCGDIVAPGNAHQVEEQVSITYSDVDGWDEPAECEWECDADYDLVEGDCLNEQSVDCTDIAAPNNAHQVEGAVTITFTDIGGWTTPTDCAWECNADFDLIADACLNEQSVDCLDVFVPAKAHQVEIQVPTYYTDDDGWTLPEFCTWECDADHDLVEGSCIELQELDCADIVPPDHAQQVEAKVLIHFTDDGGWTEPAECAWECIPGYLTADDLLCDICDNDLGYWAFGLEDDCSLSAWMSSGVNYGPGNELEMLEDGSGGAYLLWSYATTGKPDVRIQRIGPDGNVIAGWPAEGLVVCDDESSQDAPALTSDGAGGAIVAWRDTRNPRPSIYAQHVLANGTIDSDWPQNGELIYEGADYQEVRDPQLAPDSEGGAYITWWGYTGTASSSFVHLRRIAGDSSFPAGWETEKTLGVITWKPFPDAVADGVGGVYVAWKHQGCRVTRVDSDGSFPAGWGGGGIVMGQTGGAYQCMPAATDGDGGVLLSWANNGGWETGYNIRVQRILADGSTLWADADIYGGVLVSAGQFHETVPQVTSDGNGGAFIVWEDARAGDDVNDNSKHEIYAAHILSSGTKDPDWPAFWLPLSTTAEGFHRTPRVLPDGAGGAYAVWVRNSDQNLGDSQIRVTRFAADATFVPGWAIDGINLTPDETFSVDYPRFVTDNELGVFAGWYADKIGGPTVRSLRVFSNSVIPLFQ
jgi:hypothetical protein